MRASSLAACVWFYKYLGGIHISMDEEGIQKLLIAPCVPNKMGTDAGNFFLIGVIRCAVPVDLF